jgi:hypothetical protein
LSVLKLNNTPESPQATSTLKIIHQFNKTATSKLEQLIALEQTDILPLEVATRDSKSKTTKLEQLKAMVSMLTGLSVITTKSTIYMFKITKSVQLIAAVQMHIGQSEMVTKHYSCKE